MKLWHSQTYKLETSLNYSLDRVWSVDIGKDSSNTLAIGCDTGSVVVKIGSDEPVVSIKYIYLLNHLFPDIKCLIHLSFNSIPATATVR